MNRQLVYLMTCLVLMGSGNAVIAEILWTDDIQSGTWPFGFDCWQVEHPIGTQVDPADSNGANLSHVPDPLGIGGYAIRHFGRFDNGGARSQTGLWSFTNPVFGAQVTSPEGIFVAQEWFFPDTLSADNHNWPWLSPWDWHSTEPGGSNRWYSCPGILLAKDGSMRVRFEWGNTGGFNPVSDYSTIGLPVGEWFDIEMYYQWTYSTTTISLWINGELALEQSGVQTCDPAHTNVEMYVKFYGNDQGATPWDPTPSIRYTRNVRIGNSRITSPVCIDNMNNLSLTAPRLLQNVPNPFTPSTSIQYDLMEVSPVSLVIFDLTGRLIRTLVSKNTMEAGSHTIFWDGRTDAGSPVTAGVYLYRLEAGSHGETRRMVLVR